MSVRVIRSLVPAVFALAALWTAGTIADRAVQQNASTYWPAVIGVVAESEVLPGGPNGRLMHDYQVKVTYNTPAGPQEIDRISRFGRLGAYTRGGPAVLASTLRPSDTVVVHYDAANPAVGVVATGLTSAEVVSAGAIILGLVAVGLACALGAIEPLLAPVEVQELAESSMGGLGPFNRTPAEVKPFAYQRV